MRVLRASDTGWGAAKAWGQNPGNRDDQLSFKYPGVRGASVGDFNGDGKDDVAVLYALFGATDGPDAVTAAIYVWISQRSEEHTSELQSLMRISYAVFCLK